MNQPETTMRTMTAPPTRHRRRRGFLLPAIFLVAASLAAGSAMAQQQDTAQGAQPPPAQIVLSKMHALNQMEMQVGQLAMEQGSTELVRSYGERIFRDHRFGDSKVTALAGALGLELMPLEQIPADTQQMQQMRQKVEQLREQQGNAFDQMFLQMMVQSHDMAIGTLSEALGMLESEETRELVEKMIPILEQHRTLAENRQM